MHVNREILYFHLSFLSKIISTKILFTYLQFDLPRIPLFTVLAVNYWNQDDLISRHKILEGRCTTRRTSSAWIVEWTALSRGEESSAYRRNGITCAYLHIHLIRYLRRGSCKQCVECSRGVQCFGNEKGKKLSRQLISYFMGGNESR